MLTKIQKFFTNRIAIFSFLVLLQLAVFLLILLFLNSLSKYFYYAIVALTIVASIEVLSRNTYSEYKVAWIFIVAALPGFGLILYFVLGRKYTTLKQKKKHYLKLKAAHACLFDNSEKTFSNSVTSDCAKIIESTCKMPISTANSLAYLPGGKEFIEKLISDIETAKKYIFLEYFIIKKGKVWNKMLSLLEQKAANGVDVRIIYDDFGSIFGLPRKFAKYMQQKNIKVMRFNKIVPIFDARINCRNHRKLAIIDGKVAYISGANLADEYAGITKPFGFWKDYGVRITGKAVQSFVVSFFDTWKTERKTEHPSQFFSATSRKGNKIVIPFQDSPLFKSSTYEDVLLTLIYSAKNTINILTPYFILTEEIKTAMLSAAARGVVIKVIIPNIPDKKSAHELSKAFAASIMQQNINIFLYTPGFLHSKIVSVDEKYAIVGTSNLDLRSIHSNYEINLFVEDPDFLSELNVDISEAIEKSKKFSEQHKSVFAHAYRSLLRLFAPLM